jgi:hypothetical protein
LELVEIVKVGAAILGRKRPTFGGEKFNLVREKIHRKERRGIGHGRECKMQKLKCKTAIARTFSFCIDRFAFFILFLCSLCDLLSINLSPRVKRAQRGNTIDGVRLAARTLGTPGRAPVLS